MLISIYFVDFFHGIVERIFHFFSILFQVGDSVISKSKETLERAIKLVEATPKWGARVVYGDTDSLFILVPGKSKDEAFVIGNEIADAVTASNLPPIKLKFEKVLYPAILQVNFFFRTHSLRSLAFISSRLMHEFNVVGIVFYSVMRMKIKTTR